MPHLSFDEIQEAATAAEKAQLGESAPLYILQRSVGDFAVDIPAPPSPTGRQALLSVLFALNQYAERESSEPLLRWLKTALSLSKAFNDSHVVFQGLVARLDGNRPEDALNTAVTQRASSDQIGSLVEKLVAWLERESSFQLEPELRKSLLSGFTKRASDGGYEAVWGDATYRTEEWMATAVQRSLCVARIGRNQYSGLGTGFRFAGAWISEDRKSVV